MFNLNNIKIYSGHVPHMPPNFSNWQPKIRKYVPFSYLKFSCQYFTLAQIGLKCISVDSGAGQTSPSFAAFYACRTDMTVRMWNYNGCWNWWICSVSSRYPFIEHKFMILKALLLIEICLRCLRNKFDRVTHLSDFF